ncbi:nucleotide exchange factor GrpE [Haliangium ochraceum]
MRAELEATRAELATAKLEAREAAVRAHGADDELERAKARIEKESKRQIELRTQRLLLDFLEVLDDLERARASAAKEGAGGDSGDAIVQGLELVRKGFELKLAGHGVEHVPALGAAFDPSVHEAMGLVPVSDPAQNDTVVAVLSEGYRLGDEVLRPARVMIGRHG